ncbi:ABC transporter permease [Granulibacter bethesdensis]|uniref:ABC transporter permease protein n=1 Tax=Granulibacter bethesdensis (strain ATCC BAA-1260 / CGDNIH1) TaxID=391165 RepID=Q0BQU2_GRABC|nr:ABC transporter permease subunit [Granulibacter bethesdensis]ABI62810.1 ABC transporter permease protein [Granulibacter bethesdensis CGDNIH1]AHJ68239.1 ABC transporter permease protein [Granulibacter bethesdensis]APH52673.1 ABC transporter permease protein [Granulibacter bethesdensis]APH65363.1 ABC transporter permease protein [Granulibacter bethesdensis]
MVLLLAIWEGAAVWAHDPLLPSASTVIVAMVQQAMHGALLPTLAITLRRVAESFTLALVVGTAIGVALGRMPRLNAIMDSLLTALLNLPAVVLIVLIYIWFGLTEWAAVMAVALNKLPNTAVTVREGARALDPALLDMARSFRMSRLAILRHAVLPQLAPYIFAAARSGLSIIWKIVLVVELLGRSDGVGFQLQVYFQLFDVTGILVYTLAFILVVQALEWGVLQVLERRVSSWR